VSGTAEMAIGGLFLNKVRTPKNFKAKFKEQLASEEKTTAIAYLLIGSFNADYTGVSLSGHAHVSL
jgi:hypothetical protein